MFNNIYMQKALKEAMVAYKKREVPIGCVIVKNQKIISHGHNLVENKLNPLAHAELIAIEKALQKLNSKYLEDCSLYVTLEPCAMCAKAISLLRIKRLIFGAEDIKGGGIINGVKIYNCKTTHYKPEVIGGIMDNECKELLKKFFKEIRNN